MYGDLFVAGGVFADFDYSFVVTAFCAGIGSVQEAIGGTLGDEDTGSGDVVGECVPILFGQSGRRGPEDAGGHCGQSQKNHEAIEGFGEDGEEIGFVVRHEFPGHHFRSLWPVRVQFRTAGSGVDADSLMAF